MNKLGNALYEIHHMDMLAAKDQWVNKIHPLVKLFLTIAFLTVTMSFPKYDLTGLLRMGIYPIVLFIVGEISFSDSIRGFGLSCRLSALWGCLIRFLTVR